MSKILVLHGINLNMFGKRDSRQYGFVTLEDINIRLEDLGRELEIELECFQTNYEGEMCEKIHEAVHDNIQAVVINPGAWTHYNYGLRDALEILSVPIIEVHMSNIYTREAFRHYSVISDIVDGQICGLGVESYLLGLRAATNLLEEDIR